MLSAKVPKTTLLIYEALTAKTHNRTSTILNFEEAPNTQFQTPQIMQPPKVGSNPLAAPNVPTENVTYGLIENEKYLMLTDLSDHMNCFLLMIDNQEAKTRYLQKGRLVFTEEPFLFMDCASIQMRVMATSHMQRPQNIPYAVVRTVHSDYHVQEYLLGLNYAIGNSYCFAFHRNATASFRKKMRQMEQCFDNVKVLEEDFDIHSKKGQQIRAHLACNDYLIEQPDWEYALYIENSDVITKTNTEISKILRLVNGSQLVGTIKPKGVNASRPLLTARSIRLFTNETGIDSTKLDTELTLVQSVPQVFLSRQFIEAIENIINVENLINELNSHMLGADTLFFPTLSYAYHLGLPGQTKHICWNKSHGPVMTDNYYLGCYESLGSCPLKMENIYQLRWLPSIVANRIDATVDFGMPICHGLVLKFRAIRENLETPGFEFYYSLQQVIEGFERRFPNNNSFLDVQNRCTNI